MPSGRFKGLGILADLRLQHVHVRRADLAGHIGIDRALIEFFRRAALDDHAIAHHGDFLTHGQGFKLIGRGIDNGHAELAVQALQFGAHVMAQLGVKIGERFIKQQDFRLADQRTAKGNALLLAARQGVGLALKAVGEFQHRRGFVHAPGDFRRCALLPRAGDRRDSRRR